MTYVYSTELVLAGYCPYGYSSRMYSTLPTDPTQLNDTTCGPYNCESLLCGYCTHTKGHISFLHHIRSHAGLCHILPSIIICCTMEHIIH